MELVLQNIGKRFNRDWIFKNIDTSIHPESPCVITGGNGSGKSTLLQILAGNSSPSEGNIQWLRSKQQLVPDQVYRWVSISAPYLELMEEFTLQESVDFQSRFKPWRNGLSNSDVIELSGLSKAIHKQLKYYSSGMKQRVRLTLAILADTPLLLLDEPCSNLDVDAMNWYADLMGKHCDGRSVVVCSNQHPREYFFCTQELKIEAFKTTYTL